MSIALSSIRIPYQRILLFLSIGLLALMVAFFAVIQALYHPHVMSSLQKNELFFLELLFVVLVIANRSVRFPDVRRFPVAITATAGFWLIWSFLSAVTADLNYQLALYTYTEHLVLVLFGVSVYSLLSLHEDSRKYLLWVALVGFVAFCPFLLVGYFMAEDSKVTLPFDISFIDVGFRHVRHLGYYLTIILVIATGVGSVVRYENSRWPVWLAGIIATVAWALVFWAGGRGPVVAFLAALVMMIFLLGGVRKSQRLLLFVAVTFVIGAVLALLIPGGYGQHYLFSRFLVTPSEGETAIESVNRLSNSRLVIWISCIDDITRHPFFGTGQNGYTFACGSNFGGTSQPHGFHIQAALDWGIPGALAFALFLGLTLKRGLAYARSKAERIPEAVIALSGVAMLLVFSGFDGTLFQRFSLMFFAIFLAMSLPTSAAYSSDNRVQYRDGRNFFLLLLMFVVGILLFLSFNNYMLVVEYSTIS